MATTYEVYAANGERISKHRLAGIAIYKAEAGGIGGYVLMREHSGDYRSVTRIWPKHSATRTY